jgi:hypothetical protein
VRCPPVQAVVDGRGDGTAIGHEGALDAQSLVQPVPVPAGLILSDGHALSRRSAADLLLDPRELLR